MKALKFLIIAVVVVASVSSCCGCRKSKSHSSVPLQGTRWQLVQLGDQSIDPSGGSYVMTLARDGMISGVGDCNRFSGTYTTKKDKLSVDKNMVSTKKFCPNQGREDDFLKMLSRVDGYSRDGARLLLLRKGDVIAIFRAGGR